MNPKTLFDIPGVDTIRAQVPLPEPERSIARAEQGASADWRAIALAAIERIARSQETLTTDDIWALIGPPKDPRAVGPMMKRAQGQRLIAPTDRHRKSCRVECHHRPLMIWRSLIFNGCWNENKNHRSNHPRSTAESEADGADERPSAKERKVNHTAG